MSAAVALDRTNLRAASPNPDGTLCVVCISGDWDRLYAAFTIGAAALATGRDVEFFLAFWGAGALRCPGPPPPKVTLAQRIFGWLLPSSVDEAPLSRLSFGGLGKVFLSRLMHRYGAARLSQLVADVEALGGRLSYCETSLTLFGIGPDQLRRGTGICGATQLLARARGGQIIIV